jgi:hypothetical protein
MGRDDGTRDVLLPDNPGGNAMTGTCRGWQAQVVGGGAVLRTRRGPPDQQAARPDNYRLGV